MNPKAPYEVLIEDKVRNISVPDMADAIWANIEQQLDLDLNNDADNGSNADGSTPPNNTTPNTPNITTKTIIASKTIMVTITTICVIVLIIAIIINRKSRKKSSNPPKKEFIQPNINDSAVKTSHEENGVEQVTPMLTPTLHDVNKPSVQNKADNKAILPNTPPPVNKVTNNIPILDLPVIKNDTTSQKMNTINLPATKTVDSIHKTLPPPKKSRGFKGAINDDYKITAKPTNDSTRKK